MQTTTTIIKKSSVLRLRSESSTIDSPNLLTLPEVSVFRSNFTVDLMNILRSNEERGVNFCRNVKKILNKNTEESSEELLRALPRLIEFYCKYKYNTDIDDVIPFINSVNDAASLILCNNFSITGISTISFIDPTEVPSIDLSYHIERAENSHNIIKKNVEDSVNSSNNDNEKKLNVLKKKLQNLLSNKYITYGSIALLSSSILMYLLKNNTNIDSLMSLSITSEEPVRLHTIYDNFLKKVNKFLK